MANLIGFPLWHNLTLLDPSGKSLVRAPSSGYQRPAVRESAALAGPAGYSKVREADASRDGPFAHSMSMAVPVYVVGALRGVVLVDIDLISLWKPIHAIRVGQTGFVRLVTADGTVLALSLIHI